MITTKAGHEILTRSSRMSELQWIEQIARVCYKSEDKITEDGQSAKDLLGKLLNRNHYAMIEHASIILKMDYVFYSQIKHYVELINELNCMMHTYLKFSVVEDRFLVSGNMRAWLDFIKACNDAMYPIPAAVLLAIGGAADTGEILESRQMIFGKYVDFEKVLNAEYDLNTCREIRLCDLETNQEMLTHCPVTVKWTCDRGVSHELVRHRDASWAQESTRYCNYSKDKHGNECTFIDLGPGMELDAVVAKLPEGVKEEIYRIWSDAMEYAENAYLQMTTLGATPQISRSVLPNSTKTEIVMTATMDEWVKFFDLRVPASAHPQMREITGRCFDEFQNLWPNIFYDL